MPEIPEIRTRLVLDIILAILPWVVSMYVLYWLESAAIWIPETPHRDKISLAILALGMGASFLLYSYLAKRDRT
ncbi:MAG: hypothetical protein HON77_16910 [Gammaproteobacteria bacterium]|jgi:hypothetical protein|nr:hypothetical protein [Gammaproteobacteria bacterium]MBT5152861.1 hypothetical protein [Gammaproteobacteria bacterium]MBT5684360.1 hypothetical protein [Gammaproteobacteria bacterium]MBT5724245.1 hypothetical protein [Gammaproteobacteria bacterium]MBT6585981.1 hypothetical protein [Gammaproteobacteria bacterium]